MKVGTSVTAEVVGSDKREPWPGRRERAWDKKELTLERLHECPRFEMARSTGSLISRARPRVETLFFSVLLRFQPVVRSFLTCRPSALACLDDDAPLSTSPTSCPPAPSAPALANLPAPPPRARLSGAPPRSLRDARRRRPRAGKRRGGVVVRPHRRPHGCVALKCSPPRPAPRTAARPHK